MIKCWVTVLLFFWPGALWAQPGVQTLVPPQPVRVGEAFQVQYVVYDLAHFQNLETPDFGAQFRLVSGPAVYGGNVQVGGRHIPVQNFSYTLIPLQKGLLTIAGATAIYTHKQIAAPSVNISSENDDADTGDQSKTAPPPGREKASLLVKAEIGKKECYVGEPVTATFTLLSKVVTASEVIKNPGFYGFSVVEMPPDASAESSFTGGYEKHRLRKVQLYPMQAGRLVVDEMTVHNLVQFQDAAGNTFEREVVLTSEPQYIQVKPLPATAATNFTGAVGRFAIKARLKKTELAAGRTGQLLLTVSGAGNFLQLPMPEIAWPLHIEGFDPQVTAQLQNDAVPVAGRKQYEYSFTADSAGRYTIPPVVLTYFDPQEKAYNTVATDSLHLTVTPQKDLTTFFKKEGTGNRGPGPYFWLLLAAAAVVLFLALFWLARRRKEKKLAPLVNRPLNQPAINYAQQLKDLSPAQKDFKTFYTKVQQVVLQLLKQEYGIYAHGGSTAVKQLAQAPFTQKQKEALQAILEECERVQYYNAVPHIPFTDLQQKAIEVVSELQVKT